ncbi:c-type cytochrome [Chitinivorax sp. B]|uniref:c-type cytochrome n=1 Tax=Chitinivorax sp. B TaxID=2502235 RepID=UPI0010F92994|nr:c-type cytochrome [Chitinivorax sp. B]
MLLRSLLAIAGVACLWLANPASAAVDAAKAQELLGKSGCVACHTKDKKLVGPAFQEIAKKYKGNAGAEAQLIKKVVDGGTGTWGPIPMPPNKGKGSDADFKLMVQYILAQ